MESKELRELQVQIALGLITDHDLWWTLEYPNRQAPNEVCWKQDTKLGTFTLINRKYVIDPRCPDDVRRFIVRRVREWTKKNLTYSEL